MAVRQERSASGSRRSTSGLDEAADGCTKRRDNAHKIEELEVLYPWHPWFGRVIHIHEVIEQRAGGVLHCSLDGDASRRWLELPKWMFDRATCLAIRLAVSPRVDTAALIALKACLGDALGIGLCGGPLPNASGSGAGRSLVTSALHVEQLTGRAEGKTHCEIAII